MNTIRKVCPNCGTEIEVSGDQTQVYCVNCGTRIDLDEMICSGDQEVVIRTETKKKKHPVITVLLWIFAFPIMFTLFLWRSQTCSGMNRRLKIGLTAAVWVLALVVSQKTRIEKALQPKQITIAADEVYFGDGLRSCFTGGETDGIIDLSDESEVKITASIHCVESLQDAIIQTFSDHELVFEEYELECAYLEINNTTLSASDYDAENSRNLRLVEQLLNMKAGDEQEVTAVFRDLRSYSLKSLREAKDLYYSLQLIYRNDEGRTIHIPWTSANELKEEVEEETVEVAEELAEKELPAEEPQPEQTVEEVKEEPAAESTVRTGIRPEFQEAMDSYTEFFDKYAEFMESYDSSDAVMMMKYLSLMAQCEETMSKMDAIDESELSPEEDQLYLQTMLNIENKLLLVASKMN